MQIKDKVNQTLGYVEQYYHQHKRDALKPKIWDLIVTIRYLTHEVNAVKERNDQLLNKAKGRRDLSCFDCSEIAYVLTEDYQLYCKNHAVINEYCPMCGCKLTSDLYCLICDEQYVKYKKSGSESIQVDDYDKDYMYDER